MDLLKQKYHAQLGSLSTYALASHLCHFDWTGVSIRLNQIKYSGYPDQVHIDLGQARRILSNTLSMYIFRVIEFIRSNALSNDRALSKCGELFEFIKHIDDMNNSMLAGVEQSSDR